MPRPGLAIIRKSRMAAKFDDVLGKLRSLHGLALDAGAQQQLNSARISTASAAQSKDPKVQAQNLRRAITHTENAAQIYRRKGSD